MIEAIKEKDFSKFAQITIKDSNQFHAVCQVNVKCNAPAVVPDRILSTFFFQKIYKCLEVVLGYFHDIPAFLRGQGRCLYKVVRLFYLKLIF